MRPLVRVRAALIFLQPCPFGFGHDFALVDRDGVGRVFQVFAGVIDDAFRREVSDVLRREVFEEFRLQLREKMNRLRNGGQGERERCELAKLAQALKDGVPSVVNDELMARGASPPLK